MTDQPVPDPFVHEAAWQSQPRNGFGIRFAGCTNNTGIAVTCPNGNNALGVDSAVVVKNYVVQDSFQGGNINVIGDGGDVWKSGPGQLNHYEIRVSQKDIEVYGTNPFSGTWNPAKDPLVHIASITGFTLGFTRGVVWLEDAHYNGDKFNCPPTCQRNHSFHWDNFGFDGPILPRDLGFDVPANHVPDIFPGSGARAFDNAYVVPPNTKIHLTIPDVSGVANASGALLVFNFYSQSVIPLDLALNGHNLSEAWPFPDHTTFSPRTIAIPVKKKNLSDIVKGNNTLTFWAGNYLFQVANIDLILLGAGGGCPPAC